MFRSLRSVFITIIIIFTIYFLYTLILNNKLYDRYTTNTVQYSSEAQIISRNSTNETNNVNKEDKKPKIVDINNIVTKSKPNELNLQTTANILPEISTQVSPTATPEPLEHYRRFKGQCKLPKIDPFDKNLLEQLDPYNNPIKNCQPDETSLTTILDEHKVKVKNYKTGSGVKCYYR